MGLLGSFLKGICEILEDDPKEFLKVTDEVVGTLIDEDKIQKEKRKGKDHFYECIKKYKNKIDDSEINLALCYLYGIGVKKDNQKAFCLLVEGAYVKSHKALGVLGDYYYCRDDEIKDISRANYIYALARGENPQTVNQYKSIEIINSKKRNNKNKMEIIDIERSHLIDVINSIDYEIYSLESKIEILDQDTWWMDIDQREDWVKSNFSNIKKKRKDK